MKSPEETKELNYNRLRLLIGKTIKRRGILLPNPGPETKILDVRYSLMGFYPEYCTEENNYIGYDFLTLTNSKINLWISADNFEVKSALRDIKINEIVE